MYIPIAFVTAHQLVYYCAADAIRKVSERRGKLMSGGQIYDLSSLWFYTVFIHCPQSMSGFPVKCGNAAGTMLYCLNDSSPTDFFPVLLGLIP